LTAIERRKRFITRGESNNTILGVDIGAYIKNYLKKKNEQKNNCEEMKKKGNVMKSR
jgi:hypothetical protein